jgi:ABC-type lipoprotein export system ATPase subunit
VSLLELTGVRRVFHRGPEVVEALKGVDLALDRGQVGVILGASGSGKTTLLHIAGGVDRPTSGTVVFDGARIDRFTESQLTRWRRRSVGMIFQDHHLVPGLTALDNVRLPLMFSKARPAEEPETLMRRAEIAERAGFYPRQLSGGEQQRVAVARALVQGPALLLADEPTGNLDSEQGRRIFELFRDLARRDGLAVLAATHDAELAAGADRVWRLRDGVTAAA